VVEGKPENIMAIIDSLESSSKHHVFTKIVSNLIQAHHNNLDIAGAVKAYYDTRHLAAPRQSVLGHILQKCVTTNDKINIGPGTYCGLHLCIMCLPVSNQHVVTFWSRT